MLPNTYGQLNTRVCLATKPQDMPSLHRFFSTDSFTRSSTPWNSNEGNELSYCHQPPSSTTNNSSLTGFSNAIPSSSTSTKTTFLTPTVLLFLLGEKFPVALEASKVAHFLLLTRYCKKWLFLPLFTLVTYNTPPSIPKVGFKTHRRGPVGPTSEFMRLSLTQLDCFSRF